MNEITLDSILIHIGQFGKYQMLNYLILALPMFLNSIFSVTYVFTASTVNHRCNITECDFTGSVFQEPWVNFTIPVQGNGDLSQCTRFSKVSDGDYSGQCDERGFDNVIEKCDSFIVDKSQSSISNEFGIYCGDEWKLSLVGTIHNVGQFVGIPLGGLISDKFGRRAAITLGGIISAVMGIARSYSPNYTSFLVFEFLDAVGGSSLYASIFILGIEFIGPKRRVLAASGLTVFYALGEIAFGLLSKYIPDWRLVLKLVYFPSLIHIALFWILEESVRWLLTQRKNEKVKDQLRKAARINKSELPEEMLSGLIEGNEKKMEADKSTQNFPITLAFKTFFWRILNCSLCWFTNVLVYYGLSLNSVALGGNKYDNFIWISAAEIPGFFSPVLLMDRLGRRYSLFGAMIISGLSIGCSVFINSDQRVWQLALFFIGKLAITSSFQVLYFATAEMFPTKVRHSLLSFCSMFGRFGSMLAPLTPLLGVYYAEGPAIIFSACAIFSGFLALLFKETTEVELPNTLDDAEVLGNKKDDREDI